jgi:hypothetical protein
MMRFMGKYALAPGEVELFKANVETRYNNKRAPGRLILTDQRIVLIASPPSRFMFGGGAGVFGALLEKLLARPQRTEQIDRDDFATVEQEQRGMLSFHSKGEGYAHISFVVYTRKPFDEWQQRMQEWVAGTLTAASPSLADLFSL